MFFSYFHNNNIIHSYVIICFLTVKLDSLSKKKKIIDCKNTNLVK